MIVDWHVHVYPPELAKERRWGGDSPLTIEKLLEATSGSASISASSAILSTISGRKPRRSRSRSCAAGMSTAPRSNRNTRGGSWSSPARSPAAVNLS
jgi:hypothetical protein